MTIKEVEIINSAIEEYNPFKVFALFSGGNDSTCSAHIASQAKQFDGVVYIDTGIKIQETLDHARSVAEQFRWAFRIIKTPENYDDIVLKHGFPGPSSHRYMYIMLKERAIEKLFRETKTHRSQKIMLITGVRRHESIRRMTTVTSPIVKMYSKIWVAPMWEWTNEDKALYMQKHNLPQNPVKSVMHISGDCLCGAYNDRGDFEILRMFYPDEAKRIEELQNKVMTSYPWSWEEAPPKWWKQYREGQAFLGDQFMPLCWNCDLAAANNNDQI